jgi:hypothetical protein
VTAAALGGCIDDPRPFQPEAKPLPPELAARGAERAVVAITPVAGLPKPIDRELAEAMAAALGKRSLPVAIEDGAPTDALYRVSGRFKASTSRSASEPSGSVIWQVTDENGQLVARYSQSLKLDGDPASPAAKAALAEAIAGAPAAEIVKGIEGDAPRPVDPSPSDAPLPARGNSPRSVVIATIEGAPAPEGSLMLRQAIEYALRTAKVNVVAQQGVDSLLVDGTVQISAVAEGTDHVKITWSVMSQDGTVLGELSQENNVPTRLLKRVWGEIASTVAQNAAQGIAALVDEADRPKAD